MRFEAEVVISLSACLDALIRPPRFRDDFGVKNRVKDRGVIVGALRGLLPCCGLEWRGDEPRFSPLVEVAQLNRVFSCDPFGVSFSITVVSELHVDRKAIEA